MTPEALRRFAELPSATDRFEWVWSQSTDQERADGVGAYRRYNRLLTEIAAGTGHSIRTACGVFSALSPNNDYLGNLVDAVTLMRASTHGLALNTFKVHTYGANKRKAWLIAEGTDPVSVIVAPKTRSFFFNLLDPESTEHVTIDGHMFNIWNGTRLPLATRDKTKRVVSITGRRYAEIADCVRTFAAGQGLIPCQAQATLWLTWRRLHGIKTDGQLRFWDLDVERAGLGFAKVA